MVKFSVKSGCIGSSESTLCRVSSNNAMGCCFFLILKKFFTYPTCIKITTFEIGKQEISISVIHTQLSKNGRRNNCVTFAKLTRINGDVEMYLVGDVD